MSKRKREEVEEPDAATAVNYRQQRRIVDAFTQSTKELAKAFKTARGFERQKLGRRKKNAAAQKDEQDMRRIDSEVRALKTLDMIACAQLHLQKSLLKIKAVTTSPHLPAELSTARPLPKDPAALNINARLCNSNPVKEVFPKLSQNVKREFGIEEDVIEQVKKKRLRAKDYQEPTSVEGISLGAEQSTSTKHGEHRERSVQSAEANDNESSDGDMDFHSGRLADTDEEGSHSDLGSDIEGLEKRLEEEGLSRAESKSKLRPYDHAADLSLSEDEIDSGIEEEPKKARLPRKSAFIPSLTLGGYISGSGSDLDDDIDIAPKKNRRGQRARQKIWEQKYGKHAKHVQQQERTAGWDPKRGAVEKSAQRGSRYAKGANMEKLGNNRLAPTAVVKKALQKDDNGKLHPSWEAAKRAKEKNLEPVKFEGKKISFD